MGNKQKKTERTDAQKYSTDFEELSAQIVKFIFSGTDANIKKTPVIKDGGYDIIVDYFDGSTVRKVYFECKLRSDNLNLRDIAANLIIAFNEGAVALGIITNYDYTDQSNDNMSSFYEKTILNIKVIVGEDIQRLSEIYAFSISENLSTIITAKRTKGKKEYQFLKMDWSKRNFYEQFIYKQERSNPNEISFVAKINESSMKRAKCFIKNGDTICVKGLLGIGKTSFIKCLLSQLSHKEIHLVANNYLSQNQLLLGIFLDLWGIPMHNIVHDFSEEMVNKIISTVNKKSTDCRTGEIIKNLLGKTSPKGIANEHYNWLICSYLIYQLLLYKTDVKYVFYIKNAESAVEEVQILLGYICKLLAQNRIACIIERNSNEYDLLDTHTIDIFYNDVKDILHIVELSYMDKREAREFVQIEMSGYPDSLKEAIIKKGGVRLLTLNTLITYVKEKYKQQGIHAKLLEELQAFTQNDIPQPVSFLLDLYFQKMPELFCYFSFFQGKIPFEWLEVLIKDGETVIDNLINLKFLDIDDDCLIVSNELVMEKIDTFPTQHVYSAKRAAQRLLSFLNTTKEEAYIECKIAAFYYLKVYTSALPLVNVHMEKLWKERQHSAFLKYADLARDMLKEGTIELRLRLIINNLKVWVIKKQTNCPESEPWFDDFRKILFTLSGEQKKYYQLIYDYFNGNRSFKNCNFDDALSITSPYYREYQRREFEHTAEEWKEKICVVYALSVKERYGNEKALLIFETLIQLNPDSFYFRLELLSHRQCMNFYQNPAISLECITKMMKMFETEQRDDYPLPYHEYVDRAMCALCAKKFQNALEYSDNAIRILESNGIMPALGRAYNIKGCTMICMDKIDEAKRCLKEACFIMDEADYRLFSWRSRLNLIWLELKYRSDHILNKELLDMLDLTYYQFREIYLDKIIHMTSLESFYTTREYFALLMFGYAYKKLKKDRTEELITNFLAEMNRKKYLTHLRQLEDGRIKKTEFFDCPYSHEKYLFMIA